MGVSRLWRIRGRWSPGTRASRASLPPPRPGMAAPGRRSRPYRARSLRRASPAETAQGRTAQRRTARGRTARGRTTRGRFTLRRRTGLDRRAGGNRTGSGRWVPLMERTGRRRGADQGVLTGLGPVLGQREMALRNRRVDLVLFSVVRIQCPACLEQASSVVHADRAQAEESGASKRRIARRIPTPSLLRFAASARYRGNGGERAPYRESVMANTGPEYETTYQNVALQFPIVHKPPQR